MTMKSTLIGGLALVLTAAITASGAVAAPEIGKSAPDFVGVDSAGNKIRLSDYRGKTVVLEWTNHDCPYVRKHYSTGNMQAIQRKAASSDVIWFSVISSAPGRQGHVDAITADDLTKSRNAAPTAVLLDPNGKIGRLYKARTTPHMFIVKPDGTLAYKGAIDSKRSSRRSDVKRAKNYVTNALGQMAAGKEVDPAVTRAYGCSVKYGS